MRFRLSEEDRQTLGGPEWIEYDLLHLPVEDAELIEAAGGDWTAWGTQKIAGIRAAIWLALQKVGITLPYADVRFDVAAIVVDSPGKAPSGNGGSSTPSTSATSRTGTSRRKR